MFSALTKLLRSFRCAGQGIITALREQQNLRIHLIATLAAFLCGLVLRITFTEWLLIVLVIGFVWVTELLNTALELACDAITREHHPLIGKAKDVAAGAVLISSLTAASVGLLIFGRHILLLLAHSSSQKRVVKRHLL